MISVTNYFLHVWDTIRSGRNCGKSEETLRFKLSLLYNYIGLMLTIFQFLGDATNLYFYVKPLEKTR